LNDIIAIASAYAATDDDVRGPSKFLRYQTNRRKATATSGRILLMINNRKDLT
jgi:hypothetical protein